jgi:methylenetetrahydrofolate reductase (NADPH)
MEERTGMASVARFETLPFASLDAEVEEVEAPLTLTVTCSPRHGIDHTLDVAAALRERGHAVIPHVAARMIAGEAHLETLLARLRAADIDEIFLVGGDQQEPLGPYASSLDLLTAIREHSDGPGRIGVTAYPEGHPAIHDDVLLADLHAKQALADYATTQMCFDFTALVGWLRSMREGGIELPIYLGLPGVVDRRRLLEISLRVGVGTSVSFLRKQRGISRLVGNGRHVARSLLEQATLLIGSDLGVAGVHMFTFNRLVTTLRLVDITLQANYPSTAISGVAHERPSGRRS